MNQSINISSFLVNLQEPFIFKIIVIRAFTGKDHLDSVIVVVELLLDSVEIEVVSDVIIIDFAKELMVFQSAEPAYPSTWEI